MASCQGVQEGLRAGKRPVTWAAAALPVAVLPVWPVPDPASVVPPDAQQAAPAAQPLTGARRSQPTPQQPPLSAERLLAVRLPAAPLPGTGH